MTHKQVMTKYLLAFIKGLKSGGVTQVIISPGSRSTPLALLCHRDPEIQTYVDVDERGAAFMALGMAQVKPGSVALLCTSGTAAANYFPAICEAKASQIPLVVITTDRPAELRQVGAPQAMDQQFLYGSHVKSFTELALPEDDQNMLRYSYWNGMKNSYLATQQPQGTVHINVPLREPLLPDLDLVNEYQGSADLAESDLALSAQQWEKVKSLFFGKKGVIILGDTHGTEEAGHWIQAAETLGWPIIGDPLTNLTSVSGDSQVYMRQADSFLPIKGDELVPEVVLKIGRLPLSKNVMLWLKRLTKTKEKTAFVFVDESGQWLEELHEADHILHVSNQWLAQQISKEQGQETPDQWLASWCQCQEKSEAVLEALGDFTELSETSAAYHLMSQLTDNSAIFLSNSNAIRFVDRFAKRNNRQYQAYGNRGVNGIDGLVSSAVGMALSQPEKSHFLLIGDLALFHDMNGLQLAKSYDVPLTIVLLNNNGGGIFSFLSQNQLAPSDFEPLFGTPLNLDYRKVADLYEADYSQPTSLADFKTEIDRSLTAPTFKIIEVTGEQKEPVALYQAYLKTLERTLNESANEK